MIRLRAEIRRDDVLGDGLEPDRLQVVVEDQRAALPDDRRADDVVEVRGQQVAGGELVGRRLVVARCRADGEPGPRRSSARPSSCTHRSAAPAGDAEVDRDEEREDADHSAGDPDTFAAPAPPLPRGTKEDEREDRRRRDEAGPDQVREPEALGQGIRDRLALADQVRRVLRRERDEQREPEAAADLP